MTTPEQRVVFKYEIDVHSYRQFAFRARSRFLHMEVVMGGPVIWVEQPAVPPAEPEEVWTLRVVGTGHPFTPTVEEQHLASARCQVTGLVWHLYRLDASS